MIVIRFQKYIDLLKQEHAYRIQTVSLWTKKVENIVFVKIKIFEKTTKKLTLKLSQFQRLYQNNNDERYMRNNQ